MKKTKTQKGITLIALIITIVILLILAVVTINSVKDGGIIQHAQDAADKYNKAQTDEMTALDNYADQIMLSQPQIGAVKDQNGNELAIGQFIKCGEKYYVVLYNDDTEGLQIISTELKEDVTLTGIEGFENRINILSDAVKKYKEDVLGVIDARAPGNTFNEIKNFELKNTIKLIKDGTIVEVKCYGVDSNRTTKEWENLTTVLNSVLTTELVANFNSNFWLSNFFGYTEDKTIDMSYIDCLNGYVQTRVHLIEWDKNTKVITAENSVTNKILPIFLLDQRIEITGGTGTYADPYVYEF